MSRLLAEAPALSQGSFSLITGVSEVSQGAFATSTEILHQALLAILGFGMLLSRNPRWYLGWALVYVAGHTLRAFPQIVTTGLYGFILIMFALVLASYWGGASSPRGRPAAADEEPGIG